MQADIPNESFLNVSILRFDCGNTLAIASDNFIGGIKRAAEALVAAETEITRQDMIAGDGDAGLTLRSGAKGK
jgi:hypothetical protein